ncbi:prepilin peptidase [Paratractidigestivibacter sp.]|uniref:prepilin peptidase n=1 Tax=Paratractidigestivibacter sp. TaxID=2847316 RepID=UPI002ABD6B6F|nr:prepilin peptidase [Paratractidigestivibacter sp.]
MIRTAIEFACIIAAAVALALAAASDMGSRTIPNGCVAVVAVARAVSVACGESPAEKLPIALAGFATVFALLLLGSMTSRRLTGSAGIGGGDLKLLSTLGLWAGPAGGLAIVGLSCLLALAGRLLVRRAREAASFAALGRGAPLPLAPSILAASLLTCAAGLW